ncbi:MAG: thioredoxin domain-containing protein [Bacteroidales bacterium]
MTERKPNHLIRENSPYLLQHAHNPVDWHPWGEDALNAARQQNKLMVISIGYAACHWCHVMEHESFEDDDVAEAMNRDFISVKVDREERPDIDQVYMAAAYATTGRGGWPLNVIALPDQRPLFAGTYFSKRDWLHILHYFSNLRNTNPDELLHQASEIMKGMNKQQQISFTADSDSSENIVLKEIFTTWEEDLDFVHGGTHGAPKFPMPANLACLLEYGAREQELKIRHYVELTLDKLAMGGIYDHLGGGFSRYSVDARWEVPHFEKMLYDNAQLIQLYSQAYALTGKYAYKQVVEESVAFIERELTDSRGLFYASLDADSEGTEGAFYGWTNEELHKYLGENPELFLSLYSCTVEGNWEHHLNILRKSMPEAVFAGKHGIPGDQLTAFLETCRNQLFTVRSNRIRPATDDKILTCWNALMISAMVEAAKVFGKPLWLEKAISAATFYRVYFTRRNGKLWRNAMSGSFAIAGFLDDYCFLIKAFTDIYQSTFDETWLDSADALTRQVLEHFNADGGLFFNLKSNEEPSLIRETVELSDNVIPASNSQMARNLFVLGSLLNKDEYIRRAAMMVQKMVPQVRRNPAFHANWIMLLADLQSGPATVRIEGGEAMLRLQEFSGYYLPNVIFSGKLHEFGPGTSDTSTYVRETRIYVCREKTCFNPVGTVQEAILILGGQ